MANDWEMIEQTTRALIAGVITPGTAAGVEMTARAKLRELRARAAKAPPMAYKDEIFHVEDALKRLDAALGDAVPQVCIFRRPERFVLASLDDRRPGEKTRVRLPVLKVVRIGQVPFVELDGRQRVRDWWGLFVDGVKHAEGPRRWIMKNAQGAAMMDARGRLPGWILLTGLARRRAAYKRRRDQRRLERARARAREKTRRTGELHIVGADAVLTVTIDGRRITAIDPGFTSFSYSVDTRREPAAG